MSAINDSVYARVIEKAKEHHLTNQEIKAIDKAREQLNSHTNLGGFVGSLSAFLIGKGKKFGPFPLLALAGGGFLMGSQIGLISGAVAGVKTIKELPNPQRLVDVIREVQLEYVTASRNGMVPPHTQTSNNSRRQPISDIPSPSASLPSVTPDLDEFVTEDSKVHGEYNSKGSEFQSDKVVQQQQRNGWHFNTNNNSNNNNQPNIQVQVLNQQQQQQQEPNAWDKIRSQNLPNTTWSKIRKEASEHKTDPKTIEEAKAKRVQELREQESNFEYIPRTREEAQQLPSGRRNQYGDLIS
ncbi:unnamed protein product [Cunninghamella blakesleeana]